MSGNVNGNGDGDGNGDVNPDEKQVLFIQYDIPPLKSGTYDVSVQHQVNQTFTPNLFPGGKQFAVAGERYSFQPDEILCCYPPNLANGEFEGVLPHVVFTRRTLPWERTSVMADESAPWLAVLLFNEGEQPTPVQLAAADLVRSGQQITVPGSGATGTGTLPAHYLASPLPSPEGQPNVTELDYGESPCDQCMVIDIPVAVFNAVAPTAQDLPFTAHIREVDTTDSEDNDQTSVKYAVVVGNRAGQNNVKSYPFLVSLENLGDYLPNADGTPSPKMPPDTKFVRLVTYRYWKFAANTLSETFQSLVENLNKPDGPDGPQGLSSLQYPIQGTAPDAARVQQALANQAGGALTEADAGVLVANALTMAYVPLNHHLRHAGETVSWYRGPLAPYPVANTITVPISCPDAANRYDPQTGMFDVSYGAAWQLGQLLALQNTAFSTALYNWKKALHKLQVIASEHEMISQLLQGANGQVFESFIKTRGARLAQSSAVTPPDYIVKWLAGLRLLNGVPFQYLVPDESMLPPESLRLFYVDPNWIEALLDGAFSIGRSTTGEMQMDAGHLAAARPLAAAAARTLRPNRRVLSGYANTTGEVTGFLLRSQVVSGWPRLDVNGYADAAGDTEIPKLRMCRLSDDTLICLFDGAVQMVAIHEPPEQLHSGVEGAPGAFTTTLRALTGDTPGKQYLTDPKGGSPSAAVPARADNQTLIIAGDQQLNLAGAAGNIVSKLNADFGQGVTTFTAAEFALEMVKGVVKVEFQQKVESQQSA